MFNYCLFFINRFPILPEKLWGALRGLNGGPLGGPSGGPSKVLLNPDNLSYLIKNIVDTFIKFTKILKWSKESLESIDSIE